MEGHKDLKRKIGPSAFPPAHKKQKQTSRTIAKRKARERPEALIAVSAHDLPWKPVHAQGDDEAEGGMLMLEEVEDVEVVYGDGEGGNIVGFRIKESKEDQNVTVVDGQTEDAAQGTLSTPITIKPFDASLLPAWESYPLHPSLLHSIHKRGFENPTEIQKRTLEVFLNGDNLELKDEGSDGHDAVESATDEPSKTRQRDIVGIAETGSGKTLAYGLPILHHLLRALSSPPATMPVTVSPPAANKRRTLQALVLAPTRELALQVSEHLNACLDQVFAAASESSQGVDGINHTEEGGGTKLGYKAPPAVSVAAIVGGMSVQKQRRILLRGVDILVATPGRFWDLCGENSTLAAQLRGLRFLVLDEADRMVEAGHFQELDGILRMTARPASVIDNGVIPAQDPPPPDDITYADSDAAAQVCNDTLQTLVFSATMSKDLQRDLKRNYHGRMRKGTGATTLDDLLMRLDFRDPDPVIIDLSPQGGRVEGLQESKVECLTNDKDMYLYYFLLRHPGRSLVFLSSIDGIRRLMPILELLKLNAWPLHSGLQQKQRLKNLDRFKSTSNSVLLSTDVAARGLDIPAVDHVIHYQVPRTADVYVHRNGRTARAMRKGFGLVLCAPDERKVFRGVLARLGRDEDEVPELSVEHDLVDKLKTRVQLARKIDGAAHRTKKATHDRNWMRDTAEAMGIALPSELESDGSDAPRALRKRSSDVKVAAMKAELKRLLAQPLVARGVSTRYITSGSRAVVDDLIGGENNESLLGLKKLEAGGEIVRAKKKKAPRKR